MLQVTLARVDWATLPILDRLMQLYIYDFEPYFKDGVDSQGRFDPGFPLTDYLERPRHDAFLIYKHDRLAGFALVNDRVAHHTGEGRYINDFCILRSYWRQGVGRQAAQIVFKMYQGTWEVSEIALNTPAVAFWRQVIRDYTGGDYRELITMEGGYEHIWQIFMSDR